jgi:tetratricopeptide (TPR) repeat protein
LPVGWRTSRLARLLEQHSYECYLTDQVKDAIRSRRRALECWRAVGDRRMEGDTLRWLSRLEWFLGHNAEAERAGLAALEVLSDLPPGPELAMAYSNLAQLRMLANETAATIEWGTRAIELAEQLDRTDILAHALNNVGVAEMLSDPPNGRDKLERSLALARAGNLEEHVARALTNLASCSIGQRDYADAQRWLTEGITYCTEHDLDSWRLYLVHHSHSQTAIAVRQGGPTDVWVVSATGDAATPWVVAVKVSTARPRPYNIGGPPHVRTRACSYGAAHVDPFQEYCHA